MSVPSMVPGFIAAGVGKPSRVLLIVDDEEPILRSLAILFERFYSVVTAASGVAALDLLKGGLRPHVILSDNRMPEITGVQFLSKSIEHSPHSIRAIMTGYAEIREILALVNKGHLHLYLSKPWQIAEVVQAVRLCFLHYDVLKQNRDLQHETENQNTVLSEMNQQLLGSNVNLGLLSQKTMADLHLTARSLGTVLGAQEDYYHVNPAEFTARVCAAVADIVGVPEEEIAPIEIAAYLHDIGKAGLPRALRAADPETLSGEDRALYESHVERMLHLFHGVRQFERVREIVAQHHERIDGSGFPNRIGGGQLLPESQILALAATYHDLVYRLTPEEDRRRQAGETVTLAPEARLERQRRATGRLLQMRNLFEPVIYKAFIDLGIASAVPDFRLLS